MKVKFNIPYNTYYGQIVFVCGSVPELTSFDIKKGIPLIHNQGGIWNCEVEISEKKTFSYHYFVKDPNGYIHYESGPEREFVPSDIYEKYLIYDQWRPFTDESPFLSKAFKKVFFNKEVSQLSFYNNVLIRLSANNIPNNYHILISGDNEALGNWNPEKAPKLNVNKEGNYEIGFSGDFLKIPFEYKFILSYSQGTKQIFKWEEGNNRIFKLDSIAPDQRVIISHFSLNLPAQKIKYAGSSIPVFSIRSKNSFGIGEFSDLRLMIDFLAITNQKVLQILPVNDTTAYRNEKDSYPYSAVSCYALNPIYLNPFSLGLLKDKEQLTSYYKTAEELNKRKEIDYKGVITAKWNYFKQIYLEIGNKTINSQEFADFVEKNRQWLISYSVYCFLRDRYNEPNFRKWKKHSTYNKSEVEELFYSSKLNKSILLHCYLQYHLHRQLIEIHKYANEKGIIIKGDIPIGIGRNSADAWTEPHLFNFNGQAGAPPDAFSTTGQNWGFPTYNWENMEKDGYRWWRSRLQKMAEYFDAYRIDHILGFFRIWEIDISHSDGRLGVFNPSIPLSSSEMNNFGYKFELNKDCVPNFSNELLDELFGNDSESIILIFFEKIDENNFKFRDECNNQTKLNEVIDSKWTQFSQYKGILNELLTDVLFIKDRGDYNKYHPRIAAQTTRSFTNLTEHQKETYNNIYNHFYFGRNNHFWYHNAMKKLPAIITSTSMLACGEDLGMIPECVGEVMQQLSILSLEIQFMPKSSLLTFGIPANYPYLSVCTTGTHDTDTIRGWWLKNRKLVPKFYNEILNEKGKPPLECNEKVCRKILIHNLKSASMLSIFPLQDWLSIKSYDKDDNPDQHRINIPSDSNHVWSYRLSVSIEALISDKELTFDIREMISEAGR